MDEAIAKDGQGVKELTDLYVTQGKLPKPPTISMHEIQPPVNVEAQVSQHETDADTADTDVGNDKGE